MDHNLISDEDNSEFEDYEESDSIEIEEVQAYKQQNIKMKIQNKDHANENQIVINIKNEEFKQETIEKIEKMKDVITHVFINIIDDNVSDTIYANILRLLKNIKVISFKREIQFLTCTKSIKLIYDILKEINLPQLEGIIIDIPIKEKYSFDNKTEKQQNVVWDGDESLIIEEEASKTETKSKTSSLKNKKTKEQELLEKQKLVKKNKYSISMNILKLIETRCFNLKEFSLIMNSWFSDDQHSQDHEYFSQFFNSLYQIISSNSQTLSVFHLNAFQWGFYNKNLAAQHFDRIVKAVDLIKQNNLKELTLDFGRWGCEEYKNYSLFQDHNVLGLANVLLKQKDLTYLELNFRSWAYDNIKITNLSIFGLFEAISSLSKLIVLNIEISRWKHQNNTINFESIQCIAISLLQLKKLQILAISLKTWSLLTYQELVSLLQVFQSTLFLPMLIKKTKIIIDDYCYYNLKDQLMKIEETSKKQILDNKKRFYMFKTIQQQYENQFRQEIIWQMVALCSNFDYEQLNIQLKESLSLENLEIPKHLF